MSRPTLPEARRGPARTPLPPSRRRRRLRPLRAVLALLLVAAVLITVSVAPVLTRSGSDSVAARLAEWGRDHHVGFLVDWLEQRAYTPPKVGGMPAANSPLLRQRPLLAANGGGTPRTTGAMVPPPLTPFVTSPFPGEGSWSSLATVNGQVAMAAAFLRPDAQHTAYTAGVVWWNPALLHASLHPGTLDPGGRWAEPPDLVPSARAGVVAAFNSGFRLASSRGGYYADGRTARPLRAGAASMVFYRDGTLTVGDWGRDVSLTPAVAAVRQNLALLVDGGAVVPGVDQNANGAWGATLGNTKYVWRSGIGVRPDGGIVYVAGNRLTARTLGNLLVAAGCTRGMELDINPEWTSFVRYTTMGPMNLLPDMQNTPRRYDTPSSRDFIALAQT